MAEIDEVAGEPSADEQWRRPSGAAYPDAGPAPAAVHGTTDAGHATHPEDADPGTPFDGGPTCLAFQDDDAPARPSRRRRVLAILGAAAFLLFAAMLLVFGPTAMHILQARGTHLSTPAKAAGLTRDDSARAHETTDYLRTAMAAGAPVDHPVGAVYTDGSGSVIFFGGTQSAWSPDRGLRAMFDLVAGEKDGVTGVTGYDPGPLGGTLRCGSTATDDPAGAQRMTVCGWADHGSLAVAMFTGREPGPAAAVLRAMRPALERRT